MYNPMLKRSIFSDNRGTTLVEALVSVLIFSLGIIPSFVVINLANSLASSIKNNLIAANLAQEGIEVVRAIRDTNWFLDNSFDLGLADGTYRAEWNSTSLLPESGNPVLRVDTGGLYNYSTGIQTLFRRKVTITNMDPVNCNCQLRVVSEVTWPEKGRTETIRVELHLFDWQ